MRSIFYRKCLPIFVCRLYNFCLKYVTVYYVYPFYRISIDHIIYPGNTLCGRSHWIWNLGHNFFIFLPLICHGSVYMITLILSDIVEVFHQLGYIIITSDILLKLTSSLSSVGEPKSKSQGSRGNSELLVNTNIACVTLVFSWFRFYMPVETVEVSYPKHVGYLPQHFLSVLSLCNFLPCHFLIHMKCWSS